MKIEKTLEDEIKKKIKKEDEWLKLGLYMENAVSPTFLEILENAKFVKNEKEALKTYAKALKKMGKPVTHHRIITPTSGGKQIFNKPLYKAIAGEQQEAEDSCCFASRGVAVKFLTGEKRIPDKEIDKTRNIEKTTNGRIVEQEVELTFSEITKRVNPSNKLSKNEVIIINYPRMLGVPIMLLIKLKSWLAKKIGCPYLGCVIFKDPYQGIQLRFEYMFFPNLDGNCFTAAALLFKNRKTAINTAKKIFFTEKIRKLVEISEEEIKEVSGIVEKAELVETLGAGCAHGSGIDHTVPIVGVSEYKGKKYILVYDVHYKDAGTQPILDILFKAKASLDTTKGDKIKASVLRRK